MTRSLIMTSRLSTPHSYVARRVEAEYWHHRSSWMEDMLEATVAFFETTLGGAYAARILSASGSGACETFIANLVLEGQEVWVLGSEFEQLARRYGAQVKIIGKTLPEGTPSAVFIEHVGNDGTLHDLHDLVKQIRKRHMDAIVIADLSTSFGADPIDFTSLDIDGYVITPERALGGTPGCSVLAFRESVRDRIRFVRERSATIPYSFDILKYDKAWGKHTTPYSPNISSSVALATSIELIERNGGFGKHLERQATYARIVREGMRALGVTYTEGTNAFTVFQVPNAKALVLALDAEQIGVEQVGDAVRVGHMGFLSQNQLERFFTAIAKVLPGDVPSFSIEQLNEPDAWEPAFRKLFSIDPAELIEEATKAASGKTYQKMVTASARRVFETYQSYDLYGSFKTRTLGFIGAGNTVKEAAALCKRAGIERIIVYSPSLAKLSKRGTDFDNHKTIEYWESRDVEVASSKMDVFLKAHTVVLLPTFYTRDSVALLGKSEEYVNENLIDDELLTKIRDEGRMDLLINASAREGLLNRRALARHLKEGWLLYCADELPPEDDPIISLSGAYLTGHIAGSSQLTRQRIAQNTRTILEKVTLQLVKGGNLERRDDYVVNVLNEHLRPEEGWRAERGEQKEIRILLTDIFDTQTLDFAGLERICDVPIKVKDLSGSFPSEDFLVKEIISFRPHILMIRTRTVVTRKVADAAVTVPEFSFLVRPGVGIDNAYDAIASLSKAGIQIVNEPYGNSFSVGEITAHMVFNGVRKTLLAPGPTQFKREVFKIMDLYTYPEGAAYRGMRSELLRRLRPWLDRGFDPLMAATSSTGFMEAAITNLTRQGDRGFVVAHGKFGNRFIEIAQATGRPVDSLRVEDEDWGKAFSPEDIAAALAKSTYSFLCFQQNETSSGVAYNQEQLHSIIEVARAHNSEIMIIMDGVSGIGAHALEFKDLDIDAVVLGSQKALGVSSGITYLALSPRAISRMLEIAGYAKTFESFLKDPERATYLETFEMAQRVRYLSLLRLLIGEDVATPAIFHELSTLASLRLMDEEGGKEAVVSRHANLASYTREEIKHMKLETLSHAPNTSNSVTPLLTPEGTDATIIRKALLEEYGFSVAGSQSDYWKPRLMRIGHVGYVYASDVVRCLRAIRILLR